MPRFKSPGGKTLRNFGYLFLDARLSALMVAALTLGGTSQALLTLKFPLYVLSILFAMWAGLLWKRESKFKPLKTVIILMAILIGLFTLFLIKMPPALWTKLPGRDMIVEGYTLMDMSLPWLPLSLTPETTLYSLLDFLPALAVLTILATTSSAREIQFAITTVLIFALVSIVYGLMQMSGLSRELYIYEYTNVLAAVGFFSNANHLATFLIMALALALGRLSNSIYRSRHSITSAMISLFLVFGVLITGTISGYVLLLFTLGVSILLFPAFWKIDKRVLVGIVGFFLIGILADFIFLGSYLTELMDKFTNISGNSRSEFFAKSLEATKDHFPVGSGPGSFETVYKSYGSASPRFLNHAHNDVLEFVLELGLLGVIWATAFALWLGRMAYFIITKKGITRYIGRGALLALCIPLLHSTLDYPLRTMAISTLFVFCMALMALHKSHLELRT